MRLGNDADPDPEALYLCASCEAGTWTPSEHGFSEADFVLHSGAFRFVCEYVDSSGTTPGLSMLVRVGGMPGEAIESGVALQYAIDAMHDHIHKSHMAAAVAGAVAALGEGDVDVAQRMMAKAASMKRRGTSVTTLVDEDMFTSASTRGRIPVYGERMQQVTGGIGKGEYWYTGGRLKSGKSYLAACYAYAAMGAGYDVSYISLEMPKSIVAQRVHSMIIGDPKEPGDPVLRRKQVEEWMEEHGGRMFLVDRTDVSVVTPSVVGQYCREGRLVIVDYLGLMSTGASAAVEDWRAAAAITNELRAVTSTTGVAMWALGQLNRAGNTAPDLVHIADTDTTARDVDLAHLIHRPKGAPVMHHNIAANRHGPSNVTWWTRFSPETVDFRMIDGGEAYRQIQAHVARQEM